MNYIAWDTEDGEYVFFKTEEEAKKWCNERLKQWRDEAMDGWPEDIGIGYAKIVAHSVEVLIADHKDFTDEEWEEEGRDSDFDKYVDYQLKRIVGGTE